MPIALFVALARLAGVDSDVDDPAWQALRSALFLHLAIHGDDFSVPPHAVLVNLGTSLWVLDYFRFIRTAKDRSGMRYIPFVHDLAPLRVPEYCLPGMVGDFASWLTGVFHHADAFLANSQSTAQDLQDAAQRLGLPLPRDRIEVVPLDADFRPGGAELPISALASRNLAPGDFVLFVSTIEPRKNHVLAFDAWAALLRRHGPAAVPRLVCVGRDGWTNDHVFAKLIDEPLLAAHVIFISEVSDAELALLYRCCRCTLYPSRYEGWGLPVTESLSYGRIPVIADNSSLPEAGAGFALLFESGSVPALVAAMEQALFDDAWRSAQEARIAAAFVPRPWALVAQQIIAAVGRFSRDVALPVARTVRPNLYYPLRLHRRPEIWPGLGSGEIFRVGEGWMWPQAGGCRTAPPGGELRMRLAETETPQSLRLYLRLRGLASAPCAVTIEVDGEVRAQADLPQGKIRWVACDLPDRRDLSIIVRGATTESVEMPDGRHSASVAVIGFMLCDPADPGALFPDWIGPDRLPAICAYRRPGPEDAG